MSATQLPRCLAIALSVIIGTVHLYASDDVVEVQAFEEVQGCVQNSGTVKVFNEFTDIYIKVSVVAEFSNPDGAPANCSGCGNPACWCRIVSTLYIPPGTYRYAGMFISGMRRLHELRQRLWRLSIR